MRKSKISIFVLMIFLLSLGYYFQGEFGVKALGLSESKTLGKINSDNSSGKLGEKPGKTSNKDINIGKGAMPADAMTSVSEEGFSFAIQADSHLDENTNTDLYKQTLQNINLEKPAFLIDLGDTFMSEKFAKTEQEIEQRYLQAKSYFDSLNQIPLYLVNGNHEGENGWDAKKGQNNMMLWTREN